MNSWLLSPRAKSKNLQQTVSLMFWYLNGYHELLHVLVLFVREDNCTALGAVQDLSMTPSSFLVV